MARGDVNKLLNRIYCKRSILLDMPYKPSELARELDVTRRYVTDSIIKIYGVKSEKTEKGLIFINGQDVRSWIESVFDEKIASKKQRKPLEDNEFLCLKCHARRSPENVRLAEENGRTVKISYCPVCGTKMRKYLKGGK